VERVSGSQLARLETETPPESAESGGWADYSGPFDPGFQLEDLGHRALVTVNLEFALQSHLLARSFMLRVAQALDDEAAAELGRAQWTGIAALSALRLKACLGIEGDDIAAVAKIFQLHPCFHPRSYVDMRVEITGSRSAQITLGECPAFEEGDPYSWFAGLSAAPHPALQAIASVIQPRALCQPVAPPAHGKLAWEIVIDPSAEPQPTPQELKLAQISRGADFQFEQRRSLRA
ncbi:MAG: hypothetical protein VCC04_08710, partial [Myxococcota bacterium]